VPQQPLTFGDGVQKVVSILAQMELDPQADDALISEIRSVILSYVRSAGQGQGPASPDMGPAAIPGTLDLSGGMGGDPMGLGGMGGPMPVEEAGLSRGPSTSPDMGLATEELRRVMNGA
jgi:hypothetical protein